MKYLYPIPLLLLGCLVWCLFMLVRNEWVYRSRIKLTGTDDYHRLPSYDDMMKRWWVWSIKKFLKD